MSLNNRLLITNIFSMNSVLLGTITYAGLASKTRGKINFLTNFPRWAKSLDLPVNLLGDDKLLNAHSEPLLFQLQILPFEDLITHHKLMFMHAIAHSYSAVTFPQFTLNFQANTHRFNLRDNDFYIPRTNISTVQKMPIVDFPNTWNDLIHSLKEIMQKKVG